MWRSVPATMVVEALILIAGVAIYARTTRATDRTGRWAFWAFVAFLVLLYVGNASGSAPPNVNAIAWGALAGWLLPLFAWWVDRHRADTRRTTT
jgi:prepilin signal peptidase PulO-like enzyme (type II secretory pathway)